MLNWLRSLIAIKSSAHVEPVLGTSLEIQAVVGRTKTWDLAFDAALNRIDELELVFSIFKPESEFMRWQRTQGEEVAVSRELAFVLDAAERYRQTTANAFCPVADALSNAWREGKTLPEVSVEHPLWSVDLDQQTAIRHTSLPASLNAIAKGYIVDQVATEISQIPDVRQALVNIGGDLRHIGEKSVPVKITDPSNGAENAPPIVTLVISNQAVATSGGYRRGFFKDGEWQSHIFDPRLGAPSPPGQSVSAIACTAMEADAVATIAGVLPVEDALRFVDSLNQVGVLIVSHLGHFRSNSYWKDHTKTS